MKRIAFIFFVISLVVSCSDKQEVDVVSQKAVDSKESSFVVSEPMAFPDVESLNSYGWNVSTKSKSLDGFVSFAETVMQEEDYDDRPNAIMSSRFGSVLNSEGEVIVAGYFLKLTDFGLLISDLAQKETVRTLSKDAATLSLCEGKAYLPSLNPNTPVRVIGGYENIYFFDMFGFLSNAGQVDKEESAETKSPAAGLVLYDKTLNDLGMSIDPYANMTVPPSGSQKVLYDDTHCNDTKIWQQEYYVTIDRGMKVKTMKKSAGTWSKYQNPVEGGIRDWLIVESGAFGEIYGTIVDINKIKYGDRTPDPVHYVYTINARGSSMLDIVNAPLSSLIFQGNSVAASYGLIYQVDAVRFVVNDNTAYTRFPNQGANEENVKKIERDWPTLFAGYLTVSQSYVLDSSVLKRRSYYYSLGCLMYGQSRWGSDYRGSKMLYHYN